MVAYIQVAVGVAAMIITAMFGAYLHFRPGPNAIDRLGFALLPPTNSRFLHAVTWFGSTAALVLGSVSAAMAAWFTGRRNRWRSLACLIGPSAAVVGNQFLLKPVVGRLYEGELTFASGSVTVIAGVSTAWILAAPRRIRPVAVALGSTGVALMIVAVVALRWHYPTDALVGALFASGAVLLFDGGPRIFSGSAQGSDRDRLGFERAGPWAHPSARG
jgi:hypothetical protein